MIHIAGRLSVLGLMGLMILSVGCSKKPPEIMAAGGTITLNGTPLPHAEVRFYPMESGLGGNYIASGISDADGKFVLKLLGKAESSVCVCKHQVTVVDGPLPDEARGESEDSQTKAVNFIASLKNRPIPTQYANLVTSNLIVEIVPGQTDYKLELQR